MHKLRVYSVNNKYLCFKHNFPNNMVHTFSSKVLVHLQKFLSPIVVCRTTRDKFAKIFTTCEYPDNSRRIL